MSETVMEPELPPLGHRKRPLSIIEEDDDSAGSQETLEKENQDVNKEVLQDGCTRSPSFKAIKQFFIDKTEGLQNKNGTGGVHNKKPDTKKAHGSHVSSHITKPTKSKTSTVPTPPNNNSSNNNPSKPPSAFTKSVRIAPKIQSAIKSATATPSAKPQRDSTQKPTPSVKLTSKPKPSTTPSRDHNGKNTTSPTTATTTTVSKHSKTTTPAQSKATKPNSTSVIKNQKKTVPKLQQKPSKSDTAKTKSSTAKSSEELSSVPSLGNGMLNVAESIPSNGQILDNHCLEVSLDTELNVGVESSFNSNLQSLRAVDCSLNEQNGEASEIDKSSSPSAASSSSLSLSVSKTLNSDDDSISPSKHEAADTSTYSVQPGQPDCQDPPLLSENSPNTQNTAGDNSQNSQGMNGNSPISDSNTISNERPQKSLSPTLSTLTTTTPPSLLSPSSLSHHTFPSPKLITKFRPSPTLSRKYSIERNQTPSLNGKLTLATIPTISYSTTPSFNSLSLPRDISRDCSPTDSTTDEYGFLLDKSRLSGRPAVPGSPLLGSRYRPARRGSYFFKRKQSTDSLNSLSENDTLENSDDPVPMPISAADLSRLKETAEKMHLSTRRPSVLNWRQNYLDDAGLRRVTPDLDSGDVTDENLTFERKQRIDDALEWLRCELQDMRTQDQALARQLLNIRQDINELKLQRYTQENQNLLDDYKSDLEELREFSDVLDLPYPIVEDNRLKHIGITRHNIMSARRFSAC